MLSYETYINAKNTSRPRLPNPQGALNMCHLLSTPPRSEAFRHSGGDSRLCTSATVTLYLEVELSRDSLPGTEQKTSLGFMTDPTMYFWHGRPKVFLVIEMGPVGRTAERVCHQNRRGQRPHQNSSPKLRWVGLQKRPLAELHYVGRLFKSHIHSSKTGI